MSSFLNQYENLLNKIKTFNSFNDLNKFINASKSYGQKTGGLLLRLIYESNICILNDGMQAIPLDRHDIEISYLNGISKNKELTGDKIVLAGNLSYNLSESKRDYPLGKVKIVAGTVEDRKLSATNRLG